MKVYHDLQKHRLALRLFWMLVLLLIWEGGVRLTGVSPLLFPSVGEVMRVLVDSALHGDLVWQAGFSLWIIFLGMVIGLGLGFVLALLSMRFPVAGDLIDTISAIAHPLPGIAVLPLIILWFGTGTGAILAIIVHSCLWPMLLNLTAGFRSAPPIYTDVGRNLSMSSFAVTTEILIPASFPLLLSGVKIGWARAWRALISAEMVFGAIGSKGGIGWYIFKQRTFMNTAGLFAGILVVIVIGMLVEDLLFGKIERQTAEKWGMTQIRQ